MSMFARAGAPDSIRSMIIGHTVDFVTRNKRTVDKNLACYSRDLMAAIKDHVKVANIQANLGKIDWNEDVCELLVSEVKRLIPACIRPLDLDAEDNAMKLLGLLAIDDADEWLNAESFIRAAYLFSMTHAHI
jgi:hypothetical protein